MDSLPMKNRRKFYKANNGLLEEEETDIIGFSAQDWNITGAESVKYIAMNMADVSDGVPVKRN